MRISRGDVAGWIDRLSAVLHRPDGEPEEVITGYYEALQHLPREAVEDAVKLVLRTEERYFPKPATLARHARDRMPEQNRFRSPHQAWLGDPFNGAVSIEESRPCPECGSVWRWMQRQREDGTWGGARLHIRCDTERHLRSRTPAIVTYKAGDIMQVFDPKPAQQAAA